MTNASIKRRLEGTVVSAKQPQTRVVLVERVQIHPKYGKRFRTGQRYLVQDSAEPTKLGERVVIEATRPLSRLKRWRIVAKLGL